MAKEDGDIITFVTYDLLCSVFVFFFLDTSIGNISIVLAGEVGGGRGC